MHMESPFRRNNAEIIQLRRDHSALGLTENDWREALMDAESDEAVGIRHAKIDGGPEHSRHVAAIPHQVGCHFHREGLEHYSVVEGHGILFFGRAVGATVPAEEWRSIAVRPGDTFVIPEGYAHQLRRTGSGDLTIVFSCPDSHLSDAEDRFLLPDAPANESETLH